MMTEQAVQTLRPIPIEDVDNLETYDITCCSCVRWNKSLFYWELIPHNSNSTFYLKIRYWIPNSQEILLYEAFRKKTPNSPIEKVRICFECGQELIRYKDILQNEENNYLNRNAWMSCKVLISKFNCCSCGTSCDANYKVTDGFIGKIPFYRFAFVKPHQFCLLCYQNVKNAVPDAQNRIL